MNSLKVGAWALLLVALSEVPASAAWNNVFQPTLFGRLRRPTQVSNYYVAPACCPAPVVAASPPPVYVAQSPAPVYVAQAAPVENCTTKYIQRSFYQPVTVMETKSYYEPVTTTRTSYYYEPVTTYSYSYRWDSCSCCYQAIATPVTSLQVKSQQCPVQSYVQKTMQVPTKAYKLAYEYIPQKTCCTPTTTIGAPVPGDANGPLQAVPNSPQPPLLQPQATAPAGPNVGNTGNNAYYFQPSGNSGNSNWQPAANTANDRIVPEPVNQNVPAQVTQNGVAPQGAQVLFVNAKTGTRHSVAATGNGQFSLTLGAGNYHVYLANQSGATYHSQVNVNREQPSFVRLAN